jgi:urease accessory protein UreF
MEPEDFISSMNPPEIEYLEKLDEASLEAMTSTELDEKISNVANALAKQYYSENQEKGNLEDCSIEVATFLQKTANTLSGKIENAMIGRKLNKACQACRIYYHDSLEINGIEY